jgi:Flp pilus assembly pilin Flp
MFVVLRHICLEEEGQDIAEYAVMVAVILIIVVGTLRLIGSNSNTVFSSVASAIGWHPFPDIGGLKKNFATRLTRYVAPGWKPPVRSRLATAGLLNLFAWGRSTLSDTSHRNWREVYALARQEKDPARIPEICARTRRLIQNRQLELATFSRIHDDEITELEAALRELWIMEDKNR